jgi:DNA mismatch repair protein MutL
VRFRDEARLIAFVTDAVRDTLERAGTGFSAQAAPEEDALAEKGHGGQDIKEASSLPFGFEGRPPRGLELREEAAREPEKGSPKSERDHVGRTEQEGLKGAEAAAGTGPRYRLAGRLFDTYLVVEMGETVYIVDQHAAHERILFDKYCDLIKKGSVPSQQLLVPEVVTLTPQEFAQVEPALTDLVSLGFAIDLFGGHAVRVSALPFLLGNARMEDFLKELSYAGVLSDPVALRREKIAKLACRSAIKAGDAPSEEELDALFGLVIQKGSAITCPHGRPVMVEMTKKSLEKTFGRIVV